MVFTLYMLRASPPVRSVLMVIEKLGLTDVEYVDVNLFEGEHLKEEYLKMNPQHSIPTLKDGDFYIWDSHAIAVYLATKYGTDDSLYPEDHYKRAIIDQRLHFDSGVLFPSLRDTVRPVIFGGETAFQEENLNKLTKAYELTEAILTSTWLAGDALTLADICCYSTLSSMNIALPVDGALYPNLAAWMERCSQEEFVKKANEPGVQEIRALIQSKLQ